MICVLFYTYISIKRFSKKVNDLLKEKREWLPSSVTLSILLTLWNKKAWKIHAGLQWLHYLCQGLLIPHI